MKICRKCGDEKDLKHFGKLSIRLSKKASVCKLCWAKYQKEWRMRKVIEKYNQDENQSYNPSHTKKP